MRFYNLFRWGKNKVFKKPKILPSLLFFVLILSLGFTTAATSAFGYDTTRSPLTQTNIINTNSTSFNATYDIWAYNQTTASGASIWHYNQSTPYDNFNYNMTGSGDAYNYTIPAMDYADAQILLNTSWFTQTFNTTYDAFLSYNQSTPYDNFNYNMTVAGDAYNYTIPSMDYTDAQILANSTFFYNQTIDSAYNYSIPSEAYSDLNILNNISYINAMFLANSTFFYNQSTPYDNFNYNMTVDIYNYSIGSDVYSDLNILNNVTYIDAMFLANSTFFYNQTIDSAYDYNMTDTQFNYNMTVGGDAYNYSIPSEAYSDLNMLNNITYTDAMFLANWTATLAYTDAQILANSTFFYNQTIDSDYDYNMTVDIYNYSIPSEAYSDLNILNNVSYVNAMFLANDTFYYNQSTPYDSFNYNMTVAEYNYTTPAMDYTDAQILLNSTFFYNQSTPYDNFDYNMTDTQFNYNMSGGSSSYPFDQDLNTTDHPTFTAINVGNITSTGDPDTNIKFNVDEIVLAAGGINFMVIDEQAFDNVQFNPNNADVDFSISGDNDPNLFTVNGGIDMVGIGIGTPNQLLTVDGNGNFSGTIWINNDTNLADFAYNMTDTQFNYNMTSTATFDYNQSIGSDAYSDLNILNNVSYVNAMFLANDTFYYNQSTPYDNFNYNMTVAGDAYNYTIPSMDYTDAQILANSTFFYNQTIDSAYDYNMTIDVYNYSIGSDAYSDLNFLNNISYINAMFLANSTFFYNQSTPYDNFNYNMTVDIYNYSIGSDVYSDLNILNNVTYIDAMFLANSTFFYNQTIDSAYDYNMTDTQFNYNMTVGGDAYNYSIPSEAYSDLNMLNNITYTDAMFLANWTATLAYTDAQILANSTFFYNQTIDSDYDYNMTVDIYNYSIPSEAYSDLNILNNVSYVNAMFLANDTFYYNQSTPYDNFNYNMTVAEYNYTTPAMDYTDAQILLNSTFFYNQSSPYDGFNYNMSDGSYNLTYDAKNTSQWITTGSDIYYTAGYVGIGTATPSAKLEINSGATTTTPLNVSGVDTNTNEIARFEGNGAGYARFSVNTVTGEDSQFSLMEAGSTKWSFGNDGTDDSFHIEVGAGAFDTNEFVILSSGEVGIGTTPSEMLTVAGNTNQTHNNITGIDCIHFGSGGSWCSTP